MSKVILFILTAVMAFVLPLCKVGAAGVAKLTVIDDTGHTIVMQQPAARIVSLAPHLTELLFDIQAGAQVVGTVDYSDYPDEAKKIERVGSSYGLDIERIVALQPDLIVAWKSGNPGYSVTRLQTLGFQVYISETQHLDDIASTMQRLAVLAGKRRIGRQVATQFLQRKQELISQYSNNSSVSVFYEIWGQPLMTISHQHFINEVIELCGGANIFAPLSALVPIVSIEPVLAADPEVIMTWSLNNDIPDWLSSWQRWRLLHATRSDNLFFMHPDIITRHTPRILDGMQTICDFLQQARSKRTDILPHE